MKIGLILVDIQKDYFPGGRMELVGMNDASRNARELLQFFRGKKWPMFHIQHIAVNDGATFFLPNSLGMEIHENVTPISNEPVIQKHHPNSFLNTKLHEELLKAGIESRGDLRRHESYVHRCNHARCCGFGIPVHRHP